MDPNATLEELRALVANQLDGTAEVDADRMAELVAALDGWLAAGNFLPGAWEFAAAAR